MTASVPRTQPPEVRRTSLLDAAQELLQQRSADELTIEEITTTARVAKGTFYLYFKSKADLLGALRRRLEDEILAHHRHSLETTPFTDHAARLDTWFRDAIESRVSQVGLHDALFHHHSGTHGPSGAQHHIAMLAGLLEDGRTCGEFEVTDSHIVATLLYNAMHGAVDDLLHDGTSPSEPVVRAVQDLARRAVGVPLTKAEPK